MIPFFQTEEETQIIEAIRQAERQTSGEIRVHLESDAKGDILAAAARTFQQLEMDQTEARNGVLIFLAPERREFAIVGDRGIHEKVGDDFWAEERNQLQHYFRQGAYSEGVCAIIGQIGEKLKAFFPYQQDDENELSDEISYG